MKAKCNYQPIFTDLKSIKLFTFHHKVPKFPSSQNTGRLCGRWTWKTCRSERVGAPPVASTVHLGGGLTPALPQQYLWRADVVPVTVVGSHFLEGSSLGK